MENNESNTEMQFDSNQNLREFHIDNLIKTTYKKIAEWHNDPTESTSTSLKFLTLEIVEDIAGAVFKHFGLTYTSALDMDEETKKKLEAEKNKMNTPTKPVDQMTDEELMREIERRKKAK